MYPDYKELATTALLDMFVKLVSSQTEKVFFDCGLAALSADHTTPVYVSTEQIISISHLLDNIPIPEGWNNKSIGLVHQLAAAAEQYEYGDDEHLLHTMLRLRYECWSLGTGILCADMSENAMRVDLTRAVTEIPQLARTCLYAPGNDEFSAMKEFSINAARIIAEDGEWTLSFDVVRLSDNLNTTIPGSSLYSGLKKEIADWMISMARQDDVMPEQHESV